MADVKTSDEAAADTLDGTELVRIVQDGDNAQTTTAAIAALGDGGVDSAALDAAFGDDQGNILYRNATDWVVLAPGTAGQFLKTGGAAGNPEWDDAAGGGAARGLYSGVMSSDVPTASNTGLSTWVHQDSSVLHETAGGLTIERPGAGANDNYAFRSKAAPATPYKVRALVALSSIQTTGGTGIALGWYDGTNKSQYIRLLFDLNNPVELRVSSNSTPTAWNAEHAGPFKTMADGLCWLEIEDDGTDVFFRASRDGAFFVPAYTVAKASGYLGSSGYSNIVFGVAARATVAYGTLMSYEEL